MAQDMVPVNVPWALENTVTLLLLGRVFFI